MTFFSLRRRNATPPKPPTQASPNPPLHLPHPPSTRPPRHSRAKARLQSYKRVFPKIARKPVARPARSTRASTLYIKAKNRIQECSLRLVRFTQAFPLKSRGVKPYSRVFHKTYSRVFPKTCFWGCAKPLRGAPGRGCLAIRGAGLPWLQRLGLGGGGRRAECPFGKGSRQGLWFADLV